MKKMSEFNRKLKIIKNNKWIKLEEKVNYALILFEDVKIFLKKIKKIKRG